MNHYDPLEYLIEPYIIKNMRVLDIGAGDLTFAERLANKGASVTAFDVREPKFIPENVHFSILDIKQWAAHPTNEKYDCIIINNVLPFLEKKWVKKHLLPLCVGLLRKNGILCIQAFWKKPKPSFPIKSIFRKQDFTGLSTVWSGESIYRGLSKSGTEREWYLTQYIGSNN